ncbi:hypothetical protein [Agrobacterium rubi]|uniref:hypothetical protein n=1 Tax=Agrobacterium rubi TaxID=28099 RepID=UPI0005EB9438|nr:hypothetical protein [Agrobacterium rubi]
MGDHRGQSHAIWQALTTVNAPLPLHIDAETLVACLLLEETEKRWRPHVRAFFCEVGVEILMDMVVEGSVTFENFAKAISFWGVDEDYENVRWAREMAAASVTKADGAALEAIDTVSLGNVRPTNWTVGGELDLSHLEH